MRTVKPMLGVCLLAIASTLGACSSITTFAESEDDMISKTAKVLQVAQADVTIPQQHFQADLGKIYYSATVRKNHKTLEVRCSVAYPNLPDCK